MKRTIYSSGLLLLLLVPQLSVGKESLKKGNQGKNGKEEEVNACVFTASYHVANSLSTRIKRLKLGTANALEEEEYNFQTNGIANLDDTIFSVGDGAEGFELRKVDISSPDPEITLSNFLSSDSGVLWGDKYYASHFSEVKAYKFENGSIDPTSAVSILDLGQGKFILDLAVRGDKLYLSVAQNFSSGATQIYIKELNENGPVTALSVLNGTRLTGLAFGYGGALFGIAQNGHMYQVDLSTGAATKLTSVSTSTGIEKALDLSSDCAQPPSIKSKRVAFRAKETNANGPANVGLFNYVLVKELSIEYQSVLYDVPAPFVKNIGNMGSIVGNYSNGCDAISAYVQQKYDELSHPNPTSSIQISQLNTVQNLDKVCQSIDPNLIYNAGPVSVEACEPISGFNSMVQGLYDLNVTCEPQ